MIGIDTGAVKTGHYAPTASLPGCFVQYEMAHLPHKPNKWQIVKQFVKNDLSYCLTLLHVNSIKSVNFE